MKVTTEMILAKALSYFLEDDKEGICVIIEGQQKVVYRDGEYLKINNTNFKDLEEGQMLYLYDNKVDAITASNLDPNSAGFYEEDEPVVNHYDNPEEKFNEN